MQRRGGSGQPVGPKTSKAPTAQVSTADLQEQLDLRTRERDEALEQLAATSDVLQVISRSAFDLKSVLQTLVEISGTTLQSRQSCHYPADRRRVLFFRGLWFLAGIHRIRQNYPRKAGTWHGHRSSAAGRSGRSCSRCAGPADHIWARAQRLGGFRTMLGVPMLREGVPIGVLGLSRSAVQPFTDKQIELVQNFANQAVIAIENARLLNELRKSLQQQTATADVLKVISSSPGELEPVFKAMLENATRICEAKFGTMFRFDGEMFTVVAGKVGTPPALLEFQKKRGPFCLTSGSSSIASCGQEKWLTALTMRQNRVRGHAATLGGARINRRCANA